MAWPLTPLTTYIANAVPAIKAFDLNSFQSAINDLFNGNKSLKNLVVDGVGAVVGSPTLNAFLVDLIGQVTAHKLTTPSGSAGIDISGGAIVRDTGLEVLATEPVGGTGTQHRIFAGNLVCAWFQIQMLGGTFSFNDGFNVDGSSFVISNGTGTNTALTATWKTPFATSTNMAIIPALTRGNVNAQCSFAQTANGVTLQGYHNNDTALDWTSFDWQLHLIAVGHQ